jgi:hypothetical protein
VRRLGVVAALALTLAGPAAAQAPLPGGRALTAEVSVSPSTHLFGDTIVATVDVVADPREFDPERLRVSLRFRPYEPVGGVREERRRTGALVHIRYRASLRCLHVGCLAPRAQTALGGQEEGRAERHTIPLPPVEVLYRGADGHETILLTRHFQPVQVVSRINTASTGQEARRGAFTASLAPPEPTYRLSPDALAALALGAAALLALFPAALLGRALRRRWEATRRWQPLSPLERALTLVDWSARREDGAEERRKALEALAAVLDERGERELAAAARRAAWAAEAPPHERTAALGAEARAAVGGANGRPA